MRIFKHNTRLVIWLSVMIWWCAGCTAGQQRGLQTSEPMAPEAITPLPAPIVAGELSLEEALQRRRSTRSFTETPLTATEIGQILWAAQGITDARGLRTAPSAGALYPLEVYMVSSEGVYRYNPGAHTLVLVTPANQIQALYEVALEQQAILEAPVTFIITAVYARTAAKYGEARSPRYVHLEAGHAAQNILLQAVSLGLGAVPIGAFNDAQVQAVLSLPADHEPLYLIPVGHPK